LHFRPIGLTKRLVVLRTQNSYAVWYNFFHQTSTTDFHIAERTLACELKKPWRVAQKWHSASQSDAHIPAHSGESAKWRCFLNEVRTLYEQNPQDFD
jgi:hypothetical protein